ncbi:UNVERIFIED_CONTAM: hypothetical protein RMT77_009480 [Armadillidium vulgare]
MLSFDCINILCAIHQLLLAVLIFVVKVQGKPSALIGPDVINFGNLQPVTIIYQPLAIVQPQNGLPAREGAVFEGPDPGLNANIIGGTDCPNNYRKDSAGICRLEFAYGPNPFSAIIPQTFKGSLQFYMGLQVGNSNSDVEGRRRFPFRLRGRLRQRIFTRNFRPISKNSDDDDD